MNDEQRKAERLKRLRLARSFVTFARATVDPKEDEAAERLLLETIQALNGVIDEAHEDAD